MKLVYRNQKEKTQFNKCIIELLNSEQKDLFGYNISSRGRTEMTEREIFQ